MLDPKDYEVAVAKARAISDAVATYQSSRTDVPITRPAPEARGQRQFGAPDASWSVRSERNWEPREHV